MTRCGAVGGACGAGVAAVAVLAMLGTQARAENELCTGFDFLTMPLVYDGAIDTAMAYAYPDITIFADRYSFQTGTGERAYVIPDHFTTHVDPRDRLTDATFADQFTYPYPLDFDLTQREIPWNDPGRVRNEAFFHQLWFDTEAEARASLVPVRYEGTVRQATFQVTTRNCVSVQLALAFADIAALGPDMDRFFSNVGGSFNWRLIAGTDRLSVHSYGAAIDLDPNLGDYWQWSGAAEGAVGPFHNQLPEALVMALERRGFIWGGKWYHFDGMHFEYRPELILYARLTGKD